ncbi:hypothetical protein [Sphingomonas sp.]|uniref:hypothetical protein n=1 Tax=Sphingomonas sp. TaxID=28214 RepID=UPI00286CBB79|nr:hypothetical protein [Sphingomonas sp.]
MKRRVKEFVEIEEHSSLDDLIARLIAVRDTLPADSEAELRLKGDDVFGRKLSISFFRDQTAEEAECETRYAAAYKEAREKELARLQEELGVVCYPPRKGKLRIVA